MSIRELKRAAVLARVRFGPTLAAEQLQKEDGLTVHHETLRRWMLSACRERTERDR